MKKISRREFIRSSAVTAAGGMLLSFHIPAIATGAPFESSPESGSEINAWLAINPDDTITIRVAQSEMGEGVFTALPMIVAEELNADWRKVRAEYADANRSLRENRVYKRMSTGGSSAVRISRPYLQQAGAEAREKLIQAAAIKWGVPVTECYADYGKVIHKPTMRSFNYGALAATAAGMTVPEVAIKAPKDFGLLGVPTRRLDVPSKVDGSAEFGIDVRLPGMVYASVVHCPVIGGKVRGFRYNVVRNMPGVQQAVRLNNGIAIIADTWWHANSAAEKLPVDWDIGEDGKASSDELLRGFVEALGTDGVVVAKKGDVEKMLETSDKTIESDYTVPYLSHACLEPLNCTVRIGDNRVDVWAGVQSPEAVLKVVSETANVPPENVYVHNCFLGGGFGRRSYPDYVREAVLIAMEVRKPVQMIWNREEVSRQGRYRPMAAIRFRAGFDVNRKWIAYANHSVTHSILDQLSSKVKETGVDQSSIEGLVDMPYSVSDKRITHTVKDTYLTTWFWRSVGHSQNAFAMECFVDEMAEAAAMDPLQFRRSHLKDRPDMLNVLDMLAQKSNWGRAMPAGSAQGLAIHESFGTIVGQVAEVSVTERGEARVDKIVSVVDCGNLVNPMTAKEQVESAVIFALTATLFGKLTIENGRIQETNYDTYNMVTMKDTPAMETWFVPANNDKWGGMGEPGVPCVAPAVCNALYRITRRRIRSLPLKDYYLRRA